MSITTSLRSVLRALRLKEAHVAKDAKVNQLGISCHRSPYQALGSLSAGGRVGILPSSCTSVSARRRVGVSPIGAMPSRFLRRLCRRMPVLGILCPSLPDVLSASLAAAGGLLLLCCWMAIVGLVAACAGGGAL